MRTIKTSFNNSPNVGLHGLCTGNICLLGSGLHEKEEVHEALGRVEHITIAGTSMPGIFLVGNSNALLVPGITFEHEIEKLKSLGLPVVVFDTNQTCLGNNIVVNEHGALVNPQFTDTEIAWLKEKLKVPIKRMEIAGVETVGSCMVLHGDRAVIHRDAEDFEIAMAKETLKLKAIEPASVNLGSPYLRSGIIASDKGFIIGDASGGPEIVHIEESLGYLDG